MAQEDAKGTEDVEDDGAHGMLDSDEFDALGRCAPRHSRRLRFFWSIIY
jgi:hypothetical protein